MTRDDAQQNWEIIVEKGFSDYALLTKDEKVWFNVEQLVIEGIFDHYINYGAEHNQDTIDALNYLGFEDISELMKQINSFFKNGKPPVDIDERNEEWSDFCDRHENQLNEIDEKFWLRSKELELALLNHINMAKLGN